MPETNINQLQGQQGGFRTASLPDRDSGSQQQDPFQERLPPAPGQFGSKAEPPQEIPFGFQQLERSINPYIPTALNPSLRDRAPRDWGSPDYVLDGMNKYPDGEMPQGQYVPTERDIPGIIHNATMTLGRFAPPMIGMPMINAGRSFLAAQQAYNSPAYQKGAERAAQVNSQQAILQMKIADYRLSEMLRKYSSVFATFGPDESGKNYNADKLHEEVSRIASEYGDHYMQNLLNTKDWGAVDRHLKHLDGTGQDLKKTNQQLDRDIKQERLKALREKNRAVEELEGPYRNHPGTTPGATPGVPGTSGTPASRAPGRPDAGKYGDPPGETSTDPSLNWDTPPANAPDPGQRGEEPVIPDAGDTDERSDAGTPVDKTAATSAPVAPDQQEAKPARQPVRLAAADTGTMSDAPQPGATIMAMDDEGARPGVPAARAVRPPTPSAVPRSEILDRANAEGWNPVQVNDIALRRVNGALTIQDMAGLPKRLRPWMEARRGEIERQMDEMVTDPTLKGDAVFDALDKVNPQFSHTLRGYVSGDFPVPASAWKNPQYLERTVGLGQKADPTFNASTFKVRATTKQSYASGQDARNITSVATADLHIGRAEQTLRRINELDPSFLQRYMGQSRLGQQFWLSRSSPELQGLMGRLDTEIHTASNEYERAITGGKPTVSGRDAELSQLDWRWKTPEAMMAKFDEMHHLTHDRMRKLIERYKTVIGPKADPLALLYDSYTRNPASREAATDDLGSAELPSPESAAHARRMMAPAQVAPGVETRTIGGKTYYKRNGAWHDE